MVQYIAGRPIYQLCTEATEAEHVVEGEAEALPRQSRLRWWTQRMLVTDPPEEADLGPPGEEDSDLESEELDALQAAFDAVEIGEEESMNSDQLDQLEVALAELEIG